MNIPVSCFLLPIFSLSEKFSPPRPFLRSVYPISHARGAYRGIVCPAFGPGFLIPVFHVISHFNMLS